MFVYELTTGYVSMNYLSLCVHKYPASLQICYIADLNFLFIEAKKGCGISSAIEASTMNKHYLEHFVLPAGGQEWLLYNTTHLTGTPLTKRVI